MTSKTSIGTAHIEAYIHDAKISAAQLAAQLGIGQSTPSGWIGKGLAPAWTKSAIRGLRAEMSVGDVDDNADRLVVVQCNGAEAKTIRAVTVALGAHAQEFPLLIRRTAP